MSSELARRDPHQLAQAAPGGVVRFQMGAQEMEVFQKTYCKDFNPAEVNLAVAVCIQQDLNPFRNEINFWRGEGGKVVSHVTISGWVRKASETGRYLGFEGPFFCGPDGLWKDIWLDDRTPPIAAMVKVWWRGCHGPLTGVARYSEFVRRNADGKPNKMWLSMPCNQLQKCAFVNALKKAPQDQISIDALAQMDERELSSPTASEARITETPLEPLEAMPVETAQQEMPANPVEAFHQEWIKRGFDPADKAGMKDYLKRSLGREPKSPRNDADGYRTDVQACYVDFLQQPEAAEQALEQFVGDEDALMDALDAALGYRPVSLLLTTCREFRTVLGSSTAPDDDLILQ